MAQKSRLPVILFALSIVIVVVGFKALFPTPEKALVEHVVASDTSLAPKDGRRIEIHCNKPDFTKEEALKLIAHYNNWAGREGQISIHKPDRNNNYLPWAVWNAGEETKFQDHKKPN